MKTGTLYGLGVGPGDPELVTVKTARILKNAKYVFAPKAKNKSESLALDIAKGYFGEDTKVKELLFPMVTDNDELEKKWNESASVIAKILKTGEDACFLTLGDALLYSTYIYLVRALKKIMPEVKVVTVPGITAFSNVAALTNFPVGEGKENITIVPAADDLMAVREAVSGSGTVVLMKIGKRLDAILSILEEKGVIDSSVFVAYAGQANERIETDLRKLKNENAEIGYLSTILVRLNGGSRS